jgi:predicted hotdog family 3-hydroxylacyl-ACP dehydratase
MWSLAVATLGTLPSNTVSDDVFSTLLLSFFFALVARNGAKGKGPLGPVLRVTTEADLFMRDEGVAAEDVEGLFSENETSRVTRDAVRVTCEWIVAVAWVGAARRFLNVAFGIRETENGLKAQLVGWLVALVAVGARAAFVAARAAGRDEPWSHEFARDAEEAAEVFGAFSSGFGSSASQSDVTRRDGGAPIETSPNETPLLSGRPQGDDASELVRVPEEGDAGRGVRAKILDSVSVARDASIMLAGAFAFTAGVALNAAAQTTWFSVAGPDAGQNGLRLGAAASAVAYATALSAVTVAAATYAERARDASECAVECASNGDDAKRRRRVIVARELAADEERVGAFIAGFAWNAAFSALVGTTACRGGRGSPPRVGRRRRRDTPRSRNRSAKSRRRSRIRGAAVFSLLVFK